jgi:hypothetical protein
VYDSDIAIADVEELCAEWTSDDLPLVQGLLEDLRDGTYNSEQDLMTAVVDCGFDSEIFAHVGMITHPDIIWAQELVRKLRELQT